MRKSIMFTLFFIVSSVSAQQFNRLVPIGFHNPFLKSGQFISSVYFQEYYSKSIYPLDKFGHKATQQTYHMQSYLGLTDAITLSLGLRFTPKQITLRYLYSEGGDEKQNTNICPDLVLSYRPSESIEIFSTFYYTGYTNSYTPRSYWIDAPVAADEMGNVIYEQKKVVEAARSDSEYNYKNFKVGFTFSGSLW